MQDVSKEERLQERLTKEHAVPQSWFSFQVCSSPVLPTLSHFRAIRENALCGRDGQSLMSWSQPEVTGPGTLAVQALSCLSEKGWCHHIHGAQWEIYSKMSFFLQSKTCDGHGYVSPFPLQTEPKFYSEKQNKTKMFLAQNYISQPSILLRMTV